MMTLHDLAASTLDVLASRETLDRSEIDVMRSCLVILLYYSR